MIGPRPDAAPTIVMLHEGLGCVGLWGDFPDKLQKATGAGVFVYSRAGYGQSSPVKLPRPLSYMHDEARETLPLLLDAIGFQRGLLLGHSDGASIAAIYAGSHQDHRVGGLVLIAPHFFTEDAGIKSIEEARTAYETTDLRAKLSRWHKDVDNAFKGWNGAWLDPEIPPMGHYRVPRLHPRADADRAGRGRSIRHGQADRGGGTRMLLPGRGRVLPGVKHSPQREAAEAALEGDWGICRQGVGAISFSLSPCGRGCRANKVSEAGEGAVRELPPHPARTSLTLSAIHPLPQGERERKATTPPPAWRCCRVPTPDNPSPPARRLFCAECRRATAPFRWRTKRPSAWCR